MCNHEDAIYIITKRVKCRCGLDYEQKETIKGIDIDEN